MTADVLAMLANVDQTGGIVLALVAGLLPLRLLVAGARWALEAVN